MIFNAFKSSLLIFALIEDLPVKKKKKQKDDAGFALAS